MKQYSLGFAFTTCGTKVALIRKNRPEWQAGKLNGIGGKLEPMDLDIAHCMSREFKEETGFSTYPEDWNHFAHMDFPQTNSSVDCYRIFNTDLVESLKSTTDEQVTICKISELRLHQLLENVEFLIHLALTEYEYIETNLTLK